MHLKLGVVLLFRPNMYGERSVLSAVGGVRSGLFRHSVEATCSLSGPSLINHLSLIYFHDEILAFFLRYALLKVMFWNSVGATCILSGLYLV